MSTRSSASDRTSPAPETPMDESNSKQVAVIVDGSDSPMELDEGLARTEQATGKKLDTAIVSNTTGNAKKRKSQSSPNYNEISSDEDENGHESDESDVVTVTASISRPDSANKNKKPKTSKSGTSSKPASKASKPASSSSKADTCQDSGAASAIVLLKNGKLTLKQKKVDWGQQTAALQRRIKWNEHYESLDEAFDTIAEEHWPLVALMIVESDKSATEVAKQLRAGLKPPSDEDSQEAEVDKLPLSLLSKTIPLLAERVNHGLRDALIDEDERDTPEGIEVVPASLKLWRWELKDDVKERILAELPEDLVKKLEARHEERDQARAEAKKLIAALNEEEQQKIFSPGLKEKKPTVKKEDGDQEAGDASKAKPKSKKKKELTEEELAAEAEKARKKEEEKVAKAQAKQEREAKRAIKEAEKAEKEAKRAAKGAEKAEKEALKKKQEDLSKKQKNAFHGFFAKAGSSPVEVLSSASKSAKGKNSDYAHAFRPFHVKPNVEVAPVNAFLKKGKAPEKQVEIDSQPELSVQDSLKDFLSHADASRIPCRVCKTDIVSVEAIMSELNEAEMIGDVDTIRRLHALLSNPNKVPQKLLRFKEDHRLGWVGTWTKTSRTVSGRNPFKKDEDVLNYEYDSEDEWDAEEEGDIEGGVDDVNMSEDEDEDDGEVDDGWLAGDDEEIEMMEGWNEGLQDADADPFDDSAALKALAAKKTIKPTVKRRKLAGPLKPVIKGLFWQDEDDQSEELAKYFEGFSIQFLGGNKQGRLDPFVVVQKKIKPNGKSHVSSAAPGSGSLADPSATGASKPAMTVKKPMLPSDLMPQFRATVLASTATTKPKLLEELQAVFADKKVSKACIERQIGESVTKLKKAEVADSVWEMKETTTA